MDDFIKSFSSFCRNAGSHGASKDFSSSNDQSNLLRSLGDPNKFSEYINTYNLYSFDIKLIQRNKSRLNEHIKEITNLFASLQDSVDNKSKKIHLPTIPDIFKAEGDHEPKIIVPNKPIQPLEKHPATKLTHPSSAFRFLDKTPTLSKPKEQSYQSEKISNTLLPFLPNNWGDHDSTSKTHIPRFGFDNKRITQDLNHSTGSSPTENSPKVPSDPIEMRTTSAIPPLIYTPFKTIGREIGRATTLISHIPRFPIYLIFIWFFTKDILNLLIFLICRWLLGMDFDIK